MYLCVYIWIHTYKIVKTEPGPESEPESESRRGNRVWSSVLHNDSNSDNIDAGGGLLWWLSMDRFVASSGVSILLRFRLRLKLNFIKVSF
jgi:hypothetical protein